MRNCSKLSIIIPCYNEEKLLNEVNRRVQRLAAGWINDRLIGDYEVIFIDDGSSDQTLKQLIEFSKNEKRLRVIALSKNYGHQIALTAGLNRASGDAIVTLDADMQDPPEVIPQMIAKYKEGSDIIFGVRKERRGDGFWKKWTALFFYQMMRLMGADIIFNHADFRLISERVLEEFKKYRESARFLRGMIPALGFNQAMVYYDRDVRFAGVTKYSLRKMLALTIDGITSFSYFPLRLASIIGILVVIGSVLLSGWVVLVAWSGKTVPGWTSIVLPMYLLGGIQLLFLGIISEYLGKIYIESKKRPLYSIKEEYNFADSQVKP